MVEGVRELVETAEHITSTEFVRTPLLLLKHFTLIASPCCLRHYTAANFIYRDHAGSISMDTLSI